MNFNKAKIPKMPDTGAASALLKLGAVVGLGLYAAGNSLYNVEGGHRAIVFNRLVGVKDKVLLIYFTYSISYEELRFKGYLYHAKCLHV